VADLICPLYYLALLGVLGVVTLIVNYPRVQAGGTDDVSTFMHPFFQVTIFQSNSYLTWDFVVQYCSNPVVWYP